jgi:putative photosynthetic complex assembly protein 2
MTLAGALSSNLGLYALPIGWALLVWWLSTGVIIYLDNLPRATHRWSFLGGSAIAAYALVALHAGSRDASIAAAYGGFTYGLLLWGWQEMSFFMGFITGPSREPCPDDCTGGDRFLRALTICIYHEVACFAGLLAVFALTSGGINRVGAWTYLVLWAMRLSSKFNVFLGVRNLSPEFIPEHLFFIRSFLRQRPMNLLFPVSVSVASVVALLLVQHAAASLDPVATTGTVFVAVLLTLAIVEHWFLVLPLPFADLWNWSLNARQKHLAASEARHARRRAALSAATPAGSIGALGRLVPASLPTALTTPSEATHEL